MRFLRTLLPLLFCLATAARAQSVHWENDDSNPGSVVLLVFENCAPDGDPELPPIPNATLTAAGRQQSMNWVNGTTTTTVTLSYVVQAHRGGPLQIPAFTVKTDKGSVKVAAFNGAAPSVTPEGVASSTLTPDRTSVWAGEVFGLQYELNVAERYNPHPNATFDWSPGPLVAEDWSKYQVTESVVNGQREAKLTYHTRAYAKSAGALKLESVSQLVQVQTGSSSFGFFSQPRMEPVSVTSPQPVLNVKPLPSAPAGFSGAVGQFKLTSKVVPREASTGDPITWTLELSGTGNWPDIAGLPAREVSKDFQVIQPKAKRTNPEGKLFDSTLSEDVVLVPTKAGTYTLAPVEFTFFNPRTGQYETLRTDPVTVTVAAPAPPPANVAGVNAGTTPTGEQPGVAAHPPPPVAPAPTAIPRDPLPGQGNAALPLTTHVLVAWLLAPVAALIVLWLVLALRRARQTDPWRPQRAARAQIASVLGQLRAAATTNAALSPLLLEWQRATATLFRLPQAAPSADDLPDDAWATLWRETDRALYGTNPALPSDWNDRAEAALDARNVPGFNPARLFLPKNLLAFAAAVLLLLTVGSPRARAITPTPDVSYRAGDFAAAEKDWRDAVGQHPTDWVARHNLSLTLAQQDHMAEAAAQAAAAFVEHPNEPAVHWHFSYTSDKAGFVPEPLRAFLREGPVMSIAALSSPAGWQRILILAAFGLAIGLGWLLVNAYARRSRLQVILALVLGAIACGVGIVSIFGVVAYGDAADRRAVIIYEPGVLRSIPTEAETNQKTSTLAPGTIAIVDRTFLGNWDHLVFENGQTGWVRKEEVVALWR